MTHSPKDGDRLVVFLRRHRPEAPPAPPALEDKILASLETAAPPRCSGSRSPLRLVPPVLAAGVLFAWLGYQRAVVAPRQERSPSWKPF
ncbi:MAG: hypothetical protein HC925_06285 [Coleofasciculaceae cyanobacterium SM2_3_26]|nr:hypothetical protein [Coleofasciculaceae cyanobacterium SM2_3_26]